MREKWPLYNQRRGKKIDPFPYRREFYRKTEFRISPISEQLPGLLKIGPSLDTDLLRWTKVVTLTAINIQFR
jgi:hypothetical protein